MNFKKLDKYLLSKVGVTYDYPFDEKKREALGINIKQERKLFDMADRREL